MNYLLEHLPETLIGLLSLIAFFIYSIQKQKSNNELKQIKELSDSDKPKFLEQKLNDFGTTIDSSDLTPEQKYDLLKRLMNNKLRKYIIFAFTLVVLAGIIYLWGSETKNDSPTEVPSEISQPNEPEISNTFSLSSVDASFDQELKQKIKAQGFDLSNINPVYKIIIKSALKEDEKPLAGSGNADAIPYYYDEKPIVLNINGNDIATGLMVPKTEVKFSHSEARREHERIFTVEINQNINAIYNLIYENIKN